MDKQQEKIKTKNEKKINSLSFNIIYDNISVYYHPLDDHGQLHTKKSTSFFTHKFTSSNDIYLY